MLELASVPGAAHTLCDGSVYLFRLMRPIVLFCKRVAPASLFMVLRQRQMMCEVKEGCVESLRNYSSGFYFDRRSSIYESLLDDKNFCIELLHVECCSFAIFFKCLFEH